MSLQVSLKLKLSKQIKKIKVKYNTFEKATYDEYLIASLVLRTTGKINGEKNAFEYIDDITGEGSLNAHFKNIYNRLKNFSEEQLNKIMESSMIPTLKIDEKNRYGYYPQLNVSIFNGKIYQGDLGEYSNLKEIIMIQEEIIEMCVDVVRDDTKPEQYSIIFDDNNNVKVKLLDKYLPIDNEIFEKSLSLDLGNIEVYQGKIHNNAEGEGWKVLTNSALNNLLSNRNCFFEDGNHFFIRNGDVRKTIISKVHGLYIYKEEIISYQGNANLCNTVVGYLIQNGTLSEFKTRSLLLLLKYVSDVKSQKVINSLLVKKEDKEIAIYGLELMERGLITGWLITAQKTFLKYATGYQLNLIYQSNTELNYTIDQLIKIDRDLLTPIHKEQVEEYNANLEAKRKTIIEITGYITTKGLRERAKQLEADDITKKFSKLCNNLIGHVNIDLNDASLSNVEQWHKDALALKEIGLEIEKRLETKI